MRQTLMLLALGVFTLAAEADRQSTAELALFETPPYLETAAASGPAQASAFMSDLSRTALNFGECGEEVNGCEVGASKHEIMASPDKDYYGLHECIAPAAHGGPVCEGGDRLMMNRLDAAPAEYAVWLGVPGSNVELDTASHSIIIRGCEGSVAAAIPLSPEDYAAVVAL